MILTRYPGTLSAVGFGQHAFVGGGSGANEVLLRNTTAGVANRSQYTLQADGAGVLQLQMFSTTFTPSGGTTAAGGRLVLTGTGSLAIETVSSDGIRLFPGGALIASVDFANGVVVENTRGLKVKNTAGSLIDGVVISGANEMSIGSDNSAGMGATRLRGGSAISFHVSSAARVHINSTGVLYPEANGTQALGGTSNRWGVAYVSSVDTGDIVFDNKFKLTEHDKVGIKVPGMALCNADGEVVAFFDRKGAIYARRYAKFTELFTGGPHERNGA